MAESHLSDNISEWPQDHYALLNVPHNVNELDLKRAYTRLIRIYKPDREPEKFARIRQAYEQLTSHLEWMSKFNDSSTEMEITALDSDMQVFLHRPVHFSSQRYSPSTENSNRRDPVEKPNRWQSIIEDHQQRQTQYSTWKSTPEILTDREYSYLFWLLKIYPELDDCVDASYWLLNGLRKHDSRYLFDLLCHEIYEEPEIIQVPEFQMLLDQISIDYLPNMVLLRWLFTSNDKLYSIASSDCKMIESKMALSHRVAYLNFLTNAYYFFIFSKVTSAVALTILLKEKIAELQDLELSHGYLLDDMDYNDLLVKELKTFKHNSQRRLYVSTVEYLQKYKALRFLPKSILWNDFHQALLLHENESFKFLDLMSEQTPHTFQFMLNTSLAIHSCSVEEDDLSAEELLIWLKMKINAFNDSTKQPAELELTLLKIYQIENINPMLVKQAVEDLNYKATSPGLIAFADFIRRGSVLLLMSCIQYLYGDKETSFVRN